MVTANAKIRMKASTEALITRLSSEQSEITDFSQHKNKNLASLYLTLQLLERANCNHIGHLEGIVMNKTELHPDVQIGHVHLRVADLDRATDFYRDVLGFSLIVDAVPYGLPMRLLAAGGYHHVALNTFMSKGSTPAPLGHTGLHHFALLYPNRHEFIVAIQRLFDHQYPIGEASDHGATVSVYLQDPDGNGIELYYDRPRETWFDTQGNPILKNEPFDPRDLLTELDARTDLLTSSVREQGA
jgi:catechol 2,3-dioxygenase